MSKSLIFLGPFERIALVKIINEFGDTIPQYHRNIRDTEEEVLNLISEWNKVVKKYEANASIADLRQIKDSIEPLLVEDVKCKTFMPDFMTEE